MMINKYEIRLKYSFGSKLTIKMILLTYQNEFKKSDNLEYRSPCFVVPQFLSL
jgi:hypothetical protein